jgi:hypothetical protein
MTEFKQSKRREIRYSQVEGRRGALVARRPDAQKDVTGRGLDFVAAQHDAFREWWKGVRAPVVNLFLAGC